MSETRRKNSARFDPRWNFNNWAGGRWKCVDSKITLHSTFSHIAEYWGYVKVSSWPSLPGPGKFDANIYVAGRKIFLLTSKLEPNNVYYPRPGEVEAHPGEHSSNILQNKQKPYDALGLLRSQSPLSLSFPFPLRSLYFVKYSLFILRLYFPQKLRRFPANCVPGQSRVMHQMYR